MKHAEVSFKFLTPCLMSGADQKTAEMRASSIRGALRWWMRALGYGNDAVNDLFGSANGNSGKRSNVIVRDTTPGPIPYKTMAAKELAGSDFDYFLWPLRRPQDARGTIPEGTKASFSVSLRSGESDDLELALKAFLLLGALGSRSRRCYGSIWPVSVVIDGKNWHIPTDVQEMRAELSKILTDDSNSAIFMVEQAAYPKSGIAIKACADFLKKFRCGRPKSNPLKWGKNDHDAPFHRSIETVFRPALGLPLTQRYSNGMIVESSIDGYERMASPVHFKVISIENGNVPVVIFFYGMLPEDGTKVNLTSNRRKIAAPELSFDLLNAMLEDFDDSNELGNFLYYGEEE